MSNQILFSMGRSWAFIPSHFKFMQSSDFSANLKVYRPNFVRGESSQICKILKGVIISVTKFIFLTTKYRRRLGTEFGGTEFQRLFLGKTFHFDAENFWWLFLVIDLIFIFRFCLSLLYCLEMWYLAYMALYWPEKKYISEKKFLHDTFFYSVRIFARIR